MSGVEYGARHRTDAEVKGALEELMEAHATPMSAVAEVLDVDEDEASDMIEGDEYLTASDLTRLARLFGVTVDELVYTPFDTGVFRSSATPADEEEACRIVHSYAKAFRLLDAAAG